MAPLEGSIIDPDPVGRLSSHQNSIGDEDSSNVIAGFSDILELCASNFAVMTGNRTVLLDALGAGATGAILAVGCAVPEVGVEIFRAFHAGEEEHATSLQSKLAPLATAVTTKFG